MRLDNDEVAGEEDDVLAIGGFAIASGISIPRLRRYHDMGLLMPSHVDAVTGYRYYSRRQLDAARIIATLRSTDLPVEDVRRLLLGAGADRVTVLDEHVARLHGRLEDTQRKLAFVNQLIQEEKTAMATTTTTGPQLLEVVLQVEDPERTVAFYRDVFGFEFQSDDHRGTAPLHYDACGGTWNPDGFFLFTIFPADGHPTRVRFGFGVPDVDAVWARAGAHEGAQLAEPADSGYIPRAAVIADPAGNHINLYQRAGDW